MATCSEGCKTVIVHAETARRLILFVRGTGAVKKKVDFPWGWCDPSTGFLFLLF